MSPVMAAPTNDIGENVMNHQTENKTAINQDIIQGKWKQIKGKVQQKWGDLTDDDMQQAEGSREYLVGKVQERYGRTRDQAEKEVREFERGLDQLNDRNSTL